jgi:hypothetical protein
MPFTTFQFPPPTQDRDERKLPENQGQIDFLGDVGVRVTTKHEDESAATISCLLPRYSADNDYQYPTQPSFSQFSQAMDETRTVNKSASDSFTITKGPFLKSSILCLHLIGLGGSIVLWGLIIGAAGFRQEKLREGITISMTHVAFIAAIAFQLASLVRRVYLLRGERNKHSHPEAIPRHGDFLSSSSFPLWNRLPPPTYTVQSGVAIDDIEDNLVGIPPPPIVEQGKSRPLVGHMRPCHAISGRDEPNLPGRIPLV